MILFFPGSRLVLTMNFRRNVVVPACRLANNSIRPRPPPCMSANRQGVPSGRRHTSATLIDFVTSKEMDRNRVCACSSAGRTRKTRCCRCRWLLHRGMMGRGLINGTGTRAPASARVGSCAARTLCAAIRGGHAPPVRRHKSSGPRRPGGRTDKP